VRGRFSQVDTLLINQDNRPESHSRRTQFLKRMVAFSQAQRLTIRLAYYPPSHSKYNPIERCGGVLENHGNGALLGSVPTALRFAMVHRHPPEGNLGIVISLEPPNLYFFPVST
jgi:hypothetical protein